MNKEERLQTLEKVMDRMISAIDDTAPIAYDSTEFKTLLENAHSLLWFANDFRHRDDVAFPVGGDAPVTAEPEPEPAVEEAETPAPEPVPEPVEQTYLTLEEMRAKLADLINQFNIDVPGIMSGMGYAKLSEVPKARYQELLDAATAAKGA